jgi:hypothetical protein
MIDDGTCYRCKLSKWHQGPHLVTDPASQVETLVAALKAIDKRYHFNMAGSIARDALREVGRE